MPTVPAVTPLTTARPIGETPSLRFRRGARNPSTDDNRQYDGELFHGFCSFALGAIHLITSMRGGAGDRKEKAMQEKPIDPAFFGALTLWARSSEP